MTSHSDLSSASAEFGKIAVEQSNEAAAAIAIFLAISASEAYAAELEQRQAIAAAVADSVAMAQPVTVTVTKACEWCNKGLINLERETENFCDSLCHQIWLDVEATEKDLF